MIEILFQYGPITVRTFNLLIAIGFLVAVSLLLRYLHRKKMNAAFLSQHFLLLIGTIILGGRIGYILENRSLFSASPWSAFQLWDMQFSGFGAFYALLAVLLPLTRKYGEDVWAWIDAFVVGGLSFSVLYHLGHFFNGTQYGTPTDLPWPMGISFENISIPFTTPIHPIQIYAALWSLICLSATVQQGKKTHLKGVAGSLGVMLYSIGLFGAEFLRGMPSAYSKISFASLAGLALLSLIYCSHKKVLSSQII